MSPLHSIFLFEMNGEQADSTRMFAEGQIWYDIFYHDVIQSLGLSEHRDIESRDLLSNILKDKEATMDLTEIQRTIRSKKTLLVGAGPSAESDILGLAEWIDKERPFIASADGATDALLSHSIEPDVILTDLDSCSEKVLVDKSANGTPIVVHSHGDNIGLIEKIVPRLGSNILGSTQVLPIDNVVNTGGFTDGDRSAYFLAHFYPKVIVISGMDFGPIEGSFSKSRVKTTQDNGVKDFRKIKLEWGKRSLEYLISQRPVIEFFNVTRWGVDIAGARRVEYAQITKICTS